MEPSKEFLRLHLNYGRCCNECTSEDTTIVFIEICDDKLRSDIRKIVATYSKPCIEVYDICDEQTALYVDGMITNLGNMDIRVNIVYMNDDKRRIITDTAAIATPPPSASWYNDIDSVKVKYPDFYNLLR